MIFLKTIIGLKIDNNPNDIVIDLHGNVIKLQEFLI